MSISLKLIAVIFLLIPLRSSSQGCSDAGICTVPAFLPGADTLAQNRHNQIGAGISYGKADNDVSVLSSYLEYKSQLSSRVSADLKITQIRQEGGGISSNGLSDLFMNFTYSTNKKIHASAGLKIPLSDANRKLNGLALPMDFQSSMGSLDLLAGLSGKLGPVNIALAAQVPLSTNKNTYRSSEHPVSSYLASFQTTNEYERSPDLMLRISYSIPLTQTLTITPGILPIYHLSDDTYRDPSNSERISIKGSAGLTLNANLFLDYQICQTGTLGFSFGAPLVNRDARPDGLTREYVLTAAYKHRF
ncbi:MAG: hypothetical protein DWQ44_13565 [Bacteroidetes bacterium]|nr:MAG: hypothetical protein DWQ33_08375 [Bacteroidota bacterium]REK05711.1 MAG: hypothetical protein DWQ39_04680 [Bacteroidota bacterium]REK31983.1 MAG: hypothetical protein DWQ44_13565 [Bacteroidota bacterium]REK50047.1 MAG: hypothetical protein DWQ48_05785 [Bacteroidota bacterium]